MLLARNRSMVQAVYPIAKATVDGAYQDWTFSTTRQSFERYLLACPGKWRISKLIGLPLWPSGCTVDELAAGVQVQLQRVLDEDPRTHGFLRVTAGVKHRGPVRMSFWTVEDPGL